MPAAKTNYSPTILGHAILGLLHQQSQSGYQIRKTFETTPLGHFSSSPGSIYPALKRLQQEFLIERVVLPEKANSTKKKYALTRAGLDMLVTWLNEPITQDEVINSAEDILLRFALMDDLVSGTVKKALLKSFQIYAKAYAEELKSFRESASSHMPLNGLLALDHGIASYMTHAQWASYALEELSTKQP